MIWGFDLCDIYFIYFVFVLFERFGKKRWRFGWVGWGRMVWRCGDDVVFGVEVWYIYVGVGKSGCRFMKYVWKY